MTTIIVNALAIVATMALGAMLGIMIYAKSRSKNEKEKMGIKV